MKKRAYVNHPRYGNTPTNSGNNYPLEKVVDGYWAYKAHNIFAESAIRADEKKQNYAIFPRAYYVDQEKKCIACDRWFLFFAEEQKYWFEELKFYIDADCVKCVECRKSDQVIKQKALRYQELLSKSDRTQQETNRLKELAQELMELGYMKNDHKVRQIS